MAEGSAQKEIIHNGNMDILDASFAGFSVGHAKTLTNTAVSLFTMALPANTRAGGAIFSSILVLNAANEQQVLTEFIQFSVINKAGVYTTTIVAIPEADSLAVTLGTLTAVWSILTGTNQVTIRVTPTTSLTPTSYQIIYTVINHSPQAITFL
jgi:hypothetical protein